MEVPQVLMVKKVAQVLQVQIRFASVLTRGLHGSITCRAGSSGLVRTGGELVLVVRFANTCTNNNNNPPTLGVEASRRFILGSKYPEIFDTWGFLGARLVPAQPCSGLTRPPSRASKTSTGPMDRDLEPPWEFVVALLIAFGASGTSRTSK